MATITGYTTELMDTINNDTIVDGDVDGSGNLILTRRGGGTINAGSVIGPVGPMGNLDPGDIVASIRTSKTGFLHLNGQTVANANTLYPNLWAVVPASWKHANGTSLILPDMTNKVLQGGAVGEIGSVAGSNTKILVEANLPPHTHIGGAHTHTGGAHTHGMTHTHTIAHTHEHPHTHSDTFTATVLIQAAVRENSTAGDTNSLMIASGVGTSEVQENNPLGYVTVAGAVGAASDATTGGASAANTGAASTASTASGGAVATSSAGAVATGVGAGTSQPIDVQQQAIKVNYFIKT